jgi:phage head maturation protease
MNGAGTRLIHGSMVKSLGQGCFGGFGVYFTGPEEPDCDGEFFDTETDFELDEKKVLPIMFAHGLDPIVGRRRLGKASFELQPQGLWVEGKFSVNESFIQDIEQLIEEGKMFFSSAAVPHMVEKQEVGKAIRNKVWPIAEVSLTASPCCAFGTEARVLKAFETYSLKETMRRRGLSEVELLRETSLELVARCKRTLETGNTKGEYWKDRERLKYARFTADVEGKRVAREDAKERLARATELQELAEQIIKEGAGAVLGSQLLRAAALVRDASAAKRAYEGLMRRELRDYVLYQ